MVFASQVHVCHENQDFRFSVRLIHSMESMESIDSMEFMDSMESMGPMESMESEVKYIRLREKEKHHLAPCTRDGVDQHVGLRKGSANCPEARGDPSGSKRQGGRPRRDSLAHTVIRAVRATSAPAPELPLAQLLLRKTAHVTTPSSQRMGQLM